MRDDNRTEDSYYTSEDWNPAGNEYNVGMTPSERADAPDYYEEFRAWSREQMARYIEQRKHDPDISMELPPGEEPARDTSKPEVIESLASLSPEEQVAEFNRREEIERRKQLVAEKWDRALHDARAEFADQLDNQQDLIAEQTEKIEKYERKIAALEKDLKFQRDRAQRTYMEVWQEFQRQEKVNRSHLEDLAKAEKAARAEKAKARGPKPLNRVVFNVKATVSPDAEETLEAIKKRHGPTKKLRVTQGQVDGRDLWVQMEYTVRGGHPADVRRALSKCVADAGAEMVGEPIIDVIEREKLPDPDNSPSARSERAAR